MWKRLAGIAAATAMAAGIAAPATAADEPVTIGWAAWSSNEMTTKIIAHVLEEKMDQDVELVQTDIAPLYQGVANGDVDVMTVVWLPSTHSDYMDKVRDDVVNLGFIYDHAKLGWVVPSYVPEDKIDSIDDLSDPEVRDKLDGTITGIDPGAGLTRLSKKAIKDYGLDDYNLQLSSGAGMTAALKRAIDRKEWIVATGWSPHWMFGAFDIRYIDDPKGVLGSYERVHKIARKGFYQDNPEVASMLARVWMPIDDLQSAMYEARQTSYEEAAAKYVENHPKRVNYWITGRME
ncbi:hypothetical protein KBTX_03510 [wastewater metagenome]|uniref:ABC-type glycine betaine transport system substrate-binding domain-containing protein n=2 Tax=unclassified sequences TaxID=12908 RepID=A0A5B8RJB9_9ZZZZ|nr:MULTISPECIES: glycine betaine ABC transporter substrate-binding protein [Arhodomonas]MCS4503497.1 glycine betaine ABC transporter substrate-binding protein [Arhodomonas aquaeolei]QEA07165.1 hypothetical protein KBTEX_03510 [uncultured organism]